MNILPSFYYVCLIGTMQSMEMKQAFRSTSFHFCSSEVCSEPFLFNLMYKDWSTMTTMGELLLYAQGKLFCHPDNDSNGKEFWK